MIVVPTSMSVKSLVGIPIFALTLQMLFEYGSRKENNNHADMPMDAEYYYICLPRSGVQKDDGF